MEAGHKIRISILDLAAVVAVALAIFSFSRAGTLTCTIRATSCSGGETTVFKMFGLTDSHAELATSTNYLQLVCCSGVTGLGTNCTGVATTAIRLSGATNAHIQQNSYSTYTSLACLSAPGGGSVAVGYQTANCTGYDTTLASMSSATNAHVGDTTAYNTKICASADAGSVISVSVTDGIVTYGQVAFGASSSTITNSDTQSATNDGTVTENFNIKGQNTACPWTLVATSTGNELYKHEFSTNSGGLWTPLSTNYQVLSTSVSSTATTTFDLQVNIPTATACNTPQSVDVVVQAVQTP